MKVLLIETTSKAYRENPYSQMDRVLEPLAIEYIGAQVRAVGHEVVLIHQLTQSNEDVTKEIISNKPDVVGFSCMTYSYPDTVILAGAIKKEMPSVYTVLGGYHVMGMDDSPACFDFVIKGEGEISTCEVIDYIQGKMDLQYIRGLLFYKGTRWNVDARFREFTSFKRPIRLPRETYRSLSMGENLDNTRIACVIAHRGCPFQCDFCCTPQLFPGQKEVNSPQALVDEIIDLRDQMGVNTINIRDETISPDKNYLNVFCEKMIEQKVNVSWRAFANIGNVNRELLELMVQAGCHMLFLGIEASDVETLKIRRKNFKNLGSVVQDVRAAQEVGIFVRGGFIVGHENDSVESFQRHESFLREVCPDELYLSFLTPFPGTPLYQRIKKEGRLLTEDFRKYDCEHPIVDMGISANELIKLRDQLYINYYTSAEWTSHVVRRAQREPGNRETIERYARSISNKLKIPSPFTSEGKNEV